MLLGAFITTLVGFWVLGAAAVLDFVHANLADYLHVTKLGLAMIYVGGGGLVLMSLLGAVGIAKDITFLTIVFLVVVIAEIVGVGAGIFFSPDLINWGKFCAVQGNPNRACERSFDTFSRATLAFYGVFNAVLAAMIGYHIKMAKFRESSGPTPYAVMR